MRGHDMKQHVQLYMYKWYNRDYISMSGGDHQWEEFGKLPVLVYPCGRDSIV